MAVALILAVGLGVGLVVFVVMQADVRGTLKRNLVSSLALRTEWVVHEIRNASTKLRIVATRPYLINQVAADDAGGPVATVAVEKGLHAFLAMKLSGLILYTANGKVFAPAGHFMARPALVVPIRGDPGVDLLWNARRGYVLRAEIPLRKRGRVVGGIVGEAPLPALTRLFVDVRGLGASANLALCGAQGIDMRCFPDTLTPRHVLVRLARTFAGRPLPMSYGLLGHTGFLVTRNYLGTRVAAAYMPVGRTGLAMALTLDARVLYAPLRKDFDVVALLIVAILVAAILAFRWQLTPLVADLLAAERGAQEAEARWRESEAWTRAVFENVDEGIATISETGLLMTFNPAMERLFGYTETEVVGHNVNLLMPEPYHSHHDEYLRHYRETGEARVIGSGGREVVGRRRDGSEFPVDLRISEFFLGDQRRFIGTVRDATARKQAERQLEHVATHDALTDLPGRALIQTRIEQLIRRTERSGQLFAVMFLDLDGFKAINDGLGHGIGDQLLQLVARRLLETLRGEDTVGRQGGDEFIGLYPTFPTVSA